MKCIKIILILLFMLITDVVNAEIKSLVLKGNLGQSAHFQLQLDYDTQDGLVWGETTYYRKNGSRSHIQVLGSLIEKEDYAGNIISEFYLSEFVGQKLCGHFKFDLSYGFVKNGTWFLDSKELKFQGVELVSSANMRVPFNKSKPDGNDMFSKNNFFEVCHPISYKIESSVNGETEYSYFIHIDQPLLLPTACQDSVYSWIKTRLDYRGNESYYQMAKVCVNNMRQNSEDPYTHHKLITVKSQSLNYITISYFDEVYLPGSLHSHYGEECITFDKRNGIQVTDDYLYIDPYEGSLLNVICSEMKKQNPDVDFWSDDLGKPTYGPYIVNGKICYRFNPYEVGPWSAGMPSCQIDYSLLSSFLSQNGKLILGQKITPVKPLTFNATAKSNEDVSVLSDSEKDAIIMDLLRSIYDHSYHYHPDLMSEAWLDKHCSKELKQQLKEDYVDYPNSEGYAIYDLEGRGYEDIGLDLDKISHDERYYYVFLKPCIDYYKGTRILRLEVNVVYGIAVIKDFEWIKDFDNV